MTDLETLARAATRELLERSAPDITQRCAELRRIRARRTTAKLVAAAVAVGVVAGGWQLAVGRDHDDVRPVAPVHLRLDDAQIGEADFVATEPSLFPTYEGITEDGFVVRSRYPKKLGRIYDYGLLDPATGITEWLPRPPWHLGSPAPVRTRRARAEEIRQEHYQAITNCFDLFLLVAMRAEQQANQRNFTEPGQPRHRMTLGFRANSGQHD